MANKLCTAFLLISLLINSVKCECFTYNFEQNFDTFDDNMGICSTVAGTWSLGNYSDITVPAPDIRSERFISPGTSISCVSSFTFEMSSSGVFEVNLYMDSNLSDDQVTVLVNQLTETGSAAVGNLFLSPALADFESGWRSLRTTLSGSGNFVGFVTFAGLASEQSILLVDSFRYIPPDADETLEECQIYRDETESGVTESETDPTVTESNITDLTVTETDDSTIAEPNETGSTVTEPNEIGSTITEPNETGSTITEPNETGSTITEPNETGSTTTEPNETGSTTTEPNETGSTTTEPNETGTTITEPNEIGSTITEPNETGSTTTEPNETGSTTREPNETGSTTTEPNETGSTITEQNETGSTITEPNETGSTITESNETGSTITEPNETGSTITEPNETGSTITEPNETGSTITEPNETGSTITEPNETGSTITESNETGSTITESNETDQERPDPDGDNNNSVNRGFWNVLTIAMVALVSLIVLVFICFCFYEIGRCQARKNAERGFVYEDYEVPPKPIIPRVTKYYDDIRLNIRNI